MRDDRFRLTRRGIEQWTHTSPHLLSPTERIRLNGHNISEDQFAELFAVVHRRAEEMLEMEELDAHPSYFETVTAMAFLAFKARTDAAVIEVGLGGRLDATNVIQPELCVITPVAFDHEAFLGTTLSSIASEKAGILKPEVPVVLAEQQADANAVIAARAEQLRCDVIRTSDFAIRDLEVTAYGSCFTLEGTRFTCPLPGRHQIDNAVTAIVA